MGVSNGLSCEAGSFSHCLSSHRCFQSEVLRLYFPTLNPWALLSVSLPRCFSQFYLLVNVGLPTLPAAALPALVFQPLLWCESSLPWLPISMPPTSLDECFLFNSLIVGLPYSSIFWPFWLHCVFKFVVVLLLVV